MRPTPPACTLTTLLGCLFFTACAEPSAQDLGDSVADVQEVVDSVEQPLFRANDRPYAAADTTVLIYHPAYKTCFTCSWTMMNSADFGKGGANISAIPQANKQNMYLSFPNGHPDNPQNVVLLTTGQQLTVSGRDGEPDSITGQADGYQFRGREASRVMNRDSLLGRLQVSPLFPAHETYMILVHDHSADWGNSGSAAVYQQLAKFVAAKVNTNTQRVVLAGYSRGGAVVAEMARHLRSTTAPLPDRVSLYAGLFDPVAKDGEFGVNVDISRDNPLHSDSDYSKKTTDVGARLSADKRRNSSYVYNAVAGGKVAGLTVRGFGARDVELYPNYWTEHWETLAHGDFKMTPHAARLFDPFLTWLETMNDNGRDGWEAEYLTAGNVGPGVEQNFYLNARAGTTLTFAAMWDPGAGVDLDVYVYDPSGTPIGFGVSASAGDEYISMPATVTGAYRVQLYSYRGSTIPVAYFMTERDIDQIGQILLPSEQINQVSGWSRSFRVKTSGNGAVNLHLTWQDPAANLDLFVKDKTGAVLAQSLLSGGEEYVSLLASGRQDLTVQVRSTNSVATRFELRGTAPIAH